MYLGRVVEYRAGRRSVRGATASVHARAAACRSDHSGDAAPASGDDRRRRAASGRAPIAAAPSIRAARTSWRGRCDAAAPPPLTPGQAGASCFLEVPRMNVLEVDDLKKHYPIHAGMLRREVGRVRAVDGVSASASVLARPWRWLAKAAAARPPCPAASCVPWRQRQGASASPRRRAKGRSRDVVQAGDATLATPHPDDLPGPVLVAQPAHDGRRHHRRTAEGQRRAGCRAQRARA